ncbi:MAG TPA: DUF2752 domain-containing protein [Anaerolineae bacterium]|nr:DUF2752 domain-containing protein [Anaerolineae bacterium]
MSNDRSDWAAILAGTIGILLLLLIPAKTLERMPDLCLIHRTTGRRCPGCGMTHALHAGLRGDWRAALRYNWRVLIVAPLLAGLYLRAVIRIVRSAR